MTTVIHYYLFPTSNVRGTTLSQQHDAVIEAIQEWDNLGLGLQFRKVENPAEAEIRVSFENDGSWSYIGTDAIDFVSSPNATMVGIMSTLLLCMYLKTIALRTFTKTTPVLYMT